MLSIILAIILISLIFAPLGCISLWKKYIYFGDGLSHASLLAGSISIVLQLPMIYSGIIVAFFFAFAVFVLKNTAGSNAIISLVASFTLSLALIISYLNPQTINITNLLFGDILAVSLDDLIILTIILGLVIFFIWYFYSKIILIIINRDIAQIKGIKVKTIELLFLLLLSLSVFSTIKIVGALLITSILIIPAMTARFLSKTPKQMIFYSVIMALTVNSLGLITSYYLDIPITPIIIIIGVMGYIICYFFTIK